MNYFEDANLANVAKTTSLRNQARVPIILLPMGAGVLMGCIAMVVWLAVHGAVLVPGQDTRITAILISFGSRLSWLIISLALVRSAWASFLHRILAGEQIPSRTLVGVCRSFLSLGQLSEYRSLPTSFKFHILTAAFISLAMIGTSASFRYESRGQVGQSTALVSDVPNLCGQTQPLNFSCLGGALNANTTGNSWSYLEEVNAGGQGTVHRYGELGIDSVLSSNVTLAILPPSWTLGDGSGLPWMAISVHCTPLPISASVVGTGLSTNVSIIVDGSLIDVLDVPNMPEWGAIVHLYQQVNDSGQQSSLSPWKIVALSRNLNDGTANFGGLAPSAVTFLGNSYLDLHGYGPVLQGVLGAAALCEFNASTGGQWPDGSWPSLGGTSNIFFGPVTRGDRPTTATALLNFGPSWQYNPVSENTLPGGSISYIANNTGEGVSFPELFSAYIRNQWTLVAYSIPRQSGRQLSLSFVGTGPNKLYISVTTVVAFPASALFVGLLVTLRAWIYTIRQRHWVNRVEFESWWLVKALCPGMYGAGYSNATEDDFNAACQGFGASYRDIKPDNAVGHLGLCPAKPGEVVAPNTANVLRDPGRIYG